MLSIIIRGRAFRPVVSPACIKRSHDCRTSSGSGGGVSLPPLVFDYCKRDISVKSKENINVKNEMTEEEVKQEKVEKHEWLNLAIERPNQERGRDSSLRLHNLGWSQPQQAKSDQQSSVLPFSVAVGSWPSRLPPQGYVPLI